MSCIVTIPIYKDIPSDTERASIRQTYHVLGRHPIVFVTHPDCKMDEYRKIAEEEGCTLVVERFDSRYFDSVEHYSDFCFSEELYLRFKDYAYLLICQTDAWVFRDELDEWCAKGYDYIGAPLYFPYNESRFTSVFLGIGNGGFCLRRIEHCLKIVRHSRNKVFLKPSALLRIYWNYFLYNEAFTGSLVARLALIPKFLAKCFGFGNTIGFFIKNHINEDMLFGSWAKTAWGIDGVNLPDEMTAAAFAMEVHAPDLYQRLGNKLPFGCHAFMKWNYEDFWSDKINLEQVTND